MFSIESSSGGLRERVSTGHLFWSRFLGLQDVESVFSTQHMHRLESPAPVSKWSFSSRSGRVSGSCHIFLVSPGILVGMVTSSFELAGGFSSTCPWMCCLSSS